MEELLYAQTRVQTDKLALQTSTKVLNDISERTIDLAVATSQLTLLQQVLNFEEKSITHNDLAQHVMLQKAYKVQLEHIRQNLQGSCVMWDMMEFIMLQMANKVNLMTFETFDTAFTLAFTTDNVNVLRLLERIMKVTAQTTMELSAFPYYLKFFLTKNVGLLMKARAWNVLHYILNVNEKHMYIIYIYTDETPLKLIAKTAMPLQLKSICDRQNNEWVFYDLQDIILAGLLTTQHQIFGAVSLTTLHYWCTLNTRNTNNETLADRNQVQVVLEAEIAARRFRFWTPCYHSTFAPFGEKLILCILLSAARFTPLLPSELWSEHIFQNLLQDDFI